MRLRDIMACICIAVLFSFHTAFAGDCAYYTQEIYKEKGHFGEQGNTKQIYLHCYTQDKNGNEKITASLFIAEWLHYENPSRIRPLYINEEAILIYLPQGTHMELRFYRHTGIEYIEIWEFQKTGSDRWFEEEWVLLSTYTAENIFQKHFGGQQ